MDARELCMAPEQYLSVPESFPQAADGLDEAAWFLRVRPTPP